jgi:hypothetical protein
VEGAGGDEQDVVGLDHAVLGGHRAALHQRQQVALHALARDIGAAALLGAAGDLVDLVQEHDAVLLDVVMARSFISSSLTSFAASSSRSSLRASLIAACALGAIGAEVLEQALQLAGHLLHAGRGHDLDAERDC